ncbi:hypothetical protein BDR03DRAFT_958780 [Suillus americanus]|nr:hypothetical protein BDR03DRAFT_958780 [Suillus americanus]
METNCNMTIYWWRRKLPWLEEGALNISPSSQAWYPLVLESCLNESLGKQGTATVLCTNLHGHLRPRKLQ